MSSVVDHHVAALTPPQREGNADENLSGEQPYHCGEKLPCRDDLTRQMPQTPQRGDNDRREPTGTLLTGMQVGIQGTAEEHFLYHEPEWSHEDPLYGDS